MVKDELGGTWFAGRVVMAMIAATMTVGLSYGAWVGATLMSHSTRLSTTEVEVKQLDSQLAELKRDLRDIAQYVRSREIP